MDTEGCPCAPEAASTKFVTQCGVLFGREFRSPQDSGNRAIHKNNNTMCLHTRRKCYGENWRICSHFQKEWMKNLWSSVPWRRWPLHLQHSRKSCSPITSRRITNRTGMIFLKLNLTGRSSNSTSYPRMCKKNLKQPRRMRHKRSTVTTLGQVGIRRQLRNGRR